MSNDKVSVEINSDEDAMSRCQDIQGSLNDIIGTIDDKDPVKALEELEEVQEDINALHVYLTNLVESQKPHG